MLKLGKTTASVGCRQKIQVFSCNFLECELGIKHCKIGRTDYCKVILFSLSLSEQLSAIENFSFQQKAISSKTWKKVILLLEIILVSNGK